MTDELKRILDTLLELITAWNADVDLPETDFKLDLSDLNKELTEELSKPDSIEVAPGT